MDDFTQVLQNASRKLADCTQSLDAALGALHTLQTQQSATLKRMAELMSNKKDDASAAKLASLKHKLTTQARAIARQRDLLKRARTTYDTHCTNFDTLAAQYADSMARTRNETHRQERREVALIRSFERLVADRCPDLAAQNRRFQVPVENHGYIALRADRFLDLLITLDEHLRTDPEFAAAAGGYRPVSFLEVGCGQGRNMLLAQYSRILMIEKISGFDFNPELVTIGRTAMGYGDAIYLADAMEVDYSGYDVIYAYRLFSDPEMQTQLEARIVAGMRRGAYYIGCNSEDMTRYPGMHRVGDRTEIWKKRADSHRAHGPSALPTAQLP